MIPVFSPSFIPISGDWWLSGSEIDLDFVNDRYHDEGNPTNITADAFLSCSRASIGYAKTAAGALTQFASNELRITDLGLLVEDTRTNVVLWNRDLTNGAWTPTNITAAKDQTGPDGVSNSASSITATAGNGTILQAITLASSARYQSAWVKRITGSGTIEMTMDNGATWTAITVTGSWTQVTIPTQTLANPTVGFRIGTSGDAIAVDFVQNEDGVFASSPIPTTTVAATRAGETITALANLESTIAAATATALGQTNGGPTATMWFPILVGQQTNQTLFGFSDSTNGRAPQGATPLVTSNTGDFRTRLKLGHSWNASGRSIVLSGGTVATDAEAFTPLTSIVIAGVGGFQYSLTAYLERLTAWTSRLSDATLQSLTSS